MSVTVANRPSPLRAPQQIPQAFHRRPAVARGTSVEVSTMYIQGLPGDDAVALARRNDVPFEEGSNWGLTVMRCKNALYAALRRGVPLR